MNIWCVISLNTKCWEVMSDMGSYYQCSDPDSNEKNWTGHIRPLNINRNEFEVTARGSTFHLLVGKHAYGKYLCIPNWGIGTEISSLSDCFWNRGRLEQDYSELSKVDVISIVKALEALLLRFGKNKIFTRDILNMCFHFTNMTYNFIS